MESSYILIKLHAYNYVAKSVSNKLKQIWSKTGIIFITYLKQSSLYKDNFLLSELTLFNKQYPVVNSSSVI